MVPEAMHTTDQYANNRIESDHGRLKARIRPMRGLKRYRSAATLAAGHAFVQNLRRIAQRNSTHGRVRGPFACGRSITGSPSGVRNGVVDGGIP
jgi:transposase-like protein